jgi:hypothetical protein
MTEVQPEDLPFSAEQETIIFKPALDGGIPKCSIVLFTKKYDRSVEVNNKTINYIAKATSDIHGVLDDRADPSIETKMYVAVENYLTIFHKNNKIYKIKIDLSNIENISIDENRKIYMSAIDFFKKIKDEDAAKLFKLAFYYTKVIDVGFSVTESMTDPIDFEEDDSTDELDTPDFFN